MPRIGIGVTTHNRPDAFRATMEHIARFRDGARVVVVDDASSPAVEPYVDRWLTYYRFEQNAGIARAKNKCLELLDDCEHIFLFDDDAYPVSEGWWKPYVDSPEPHLMRIFKDLAGRRKLNDVTVIHEGGGHISYSGARGAMLYVHRSVLDQVGGMDTAYGRWGYEHVDWSRRIHNAGLTTFPFTDVTWSDALVRCMDEFEEVGRSVPATQRQRLAAENAKRYHSNLRRGTYIEYREQRDVVLTTLLTSKVDPQRGRKWDPTFSQLETLARSLAKHGQKLVVLHDEMDEKGPENVEFVRVEPHFSPYFQRWVSIWQYLRDHPGVGRVWCVDGSDVEMLRNPFEPGAMRPDVVYTGCEQTTVGTEWMTRHHRAKFLQDFMREHADRHLLNAGLLGGTRAAVMAFTHALLAELNDHTARIFHREDRETLGVGDMALFNYVAYTQFADRIFTGPRVCSTFKREESAAQAPSAWWRHK